MNGSRSAIIKFLAEYRRDGDKQKIQEVIIGGFTLNLAIGLATTFTVMALSGLLANRVFKAPELASIIRILSISIFSQALVSTSSAIIVGFEKMEQSIMVQILQSISKTLIGPVLILMGFGVVGAAYGYSLPIFISGCLAVLFVYLNNRDLKISRSLFNRETYKTIIVYTIPLFLANLIGGGTGRFYDFLLSVNTSAEVIGNYSAAKSMSVLVQFFISPISTATFPLLSKLRPKDPAFKLVYQNIIKYESMIIFPITFAIIALSDQFVDILYGPTYTQTSLYMQLFMLNFLFIGIGRIVNLNLLNSQRETKITFRVTLIQLILGVPMGFLLIPRYGVLGFIIIQLTAPKIGLLYSLIWIKRSYGIAPNFRDVAKLFISSIVGFLVCTLFLRFSSFGAWIELIAGGIIIMLSYLIMILASGALRKENLRDIQKLLGNYELLASIIDPVFSVLIRVSRE
jgi:O-antigen/teichoic acid export membrane protein